MENKTVSFSRRILAGFVDFVCIAVGCLLLYFFAAVPVMNSKFNFENKVNRYYEIYQEVVVDVGVGKVEVKDEKETLIVWDTFEKYLDGIGVESSALNNEEKNTYQKEYEGKVELFNKTLNENEEFLKLYQEIPNIQKGAFIISATIPELIFLLLVPYLNKKRKTLGNFAAKSRVIDKNDLELKPWQVPVRFLVLWAIESVLLLWMFLDTAIVVAGIISAVSMMLTKNHNCIHDTLSSTKVVEDSENSVVFHSVDEKAEYILEQNKNVVSKEETPLIDLTEKEEKGEETPTEETNVEEKKEDVEETPQEEKKDEKEGEKDSPDTKQE